MIHIKEIEKCPKVKSDGWQRDPKLAALCSTTRPAKLCPNLRIQRILEFRIAFAEKRDAREFKDGDWGSRGIELCLCRHASDADIGLPVDVMLASTGN